jgi:hypothetical protein
VAAPTSGQAARTRGPGGLLFGYAGLTERAILDGVRVIAGIVRTLRTNDVR